ncbi:MULTISPECIES: hypothetical protein [Priestia]|uniref:hypothetical protein n=1 Tax=Priestia TaxID=2800373 RepID=UPI000762320E|nr:MULTISPECIES: hypothetical protein [Priestia]KWU61002.1 hypothetical protein AWX17_19440 [Priestia megaterium]MCE4092775.1 hypothetical protein [Priestia megaterium]MED3822015.1 hypothetical protein [Priestia aryabhattai]
MNKKEKAKFSFKMNILFIIVFLLFTTLIIRLFFVQIVNGEVYQREIGKIETRETPVPRQNVDDRDNQ